MIIARRSRAWSRIASLALVLASCHAGALAVTLAPSVVGNVYELAPFDGFAEGTGTPALVANVNDRRQSVAYEYDLTSVLPGLVTSARLTGRIGPNNSFDTGTRIHNFDLYTGNGSIDLADYSVPGIRVGSASHASGGTSDFDFDVQGVLHNLLAAGASYLGVRVSPGADPQGYDALYTSSIVPELTFSLLPEGSTTIQKQPVVDARAELTGGNFVVTDGQTSLGVQSVDFAAIDRRAILEFDLTDVPIGAVVASASLYLDLNSFSHGDTDFPEPRFYGYAGDGVATPADAVQTTTLLAPADPVTELVPLTVELDATQIESLLATSQHLGVLIVGSDNHNSISFAATESAQLGFGIAPTLSLTYVAPPNMPGDYSGDGNVGPEDYALWKSTFGAAAGDLRADGNGDGIVNAADYTIWRNHVSSPGAAASTAQVPEPATPSLLFLAGVALAFSVSTVSGRNRRATRTTWAL